MGESVRRAFVILNASAGWDEQADAAGRIRRVFQQSGHDCVVKRASEGANIELLAAEALHSGAERVIAGGGDGTVRAVAAALAGTDALMGVLPVGTLNHFARDMKIPLDLERAAAVAAEGTPVCVDVGEVNGHVFVNNSIVGLYAFYRAQRDAHEAHGRAKQLAILAAVFRTLWSHPYLTLRLRINGEDLVRRTPYVLIANNEHAMEGFQPWERKSMTEASLWIYLLRDSRRLGLLRLLAKIASGGTLAYEEFEVLRAEEVTMETRRRRLRVALDGEVISIASPLRYRSRPGELKVLVPKGGERVSESLCPTAAKLP
jgi:YegS/Rv2252/BmrU family lipid kinase